MKSPSGVTSSWMLGQDPRVLGLGMAVRFVEYQVVPDPPPVDLVGRLEVPAGVAQLLEALAALRTGEHAFVVSVLFHKIDGRKNTGGVGEYGDGISRRRLLMVIWDEWSPNGSYTRVNDNS